MGTRVAVFTFSAIVVIFFSTARKEMLRRKVNWSLANKTERKFWNRMFFEEINNYIVQNTLIKNSLEKIIETLLACVVDFYCSNLFFMQAWFFANQITESNRSQGSAWRSDWISIMLCYSRELNLSVWGSRYRHLSRRNVAELRNEHILTEWTTRRLPKIEIVVMFHSCY